MLMAAKALLDRNPSPTREDVVEAISGNICRCTGYEPIINAILDAASQARRAAKRRAGPCSNCAKSIFADERDDSLNEVGQPTPAPGHVRATSPAARAISTTIAFAGLLHLKVLRSPHHHARIRSHRHIGGRALAQASSA